MSLSALISDFTLHYLAFGCLAGLLSGLFGIGGGVVMVPFLSWRLASEGVLADDRMIVAVATSLAAIVLTSLSSITAHHRRGAVVWPLVFRLAPGILVGSLSGTVIARELPVLWFTLIFAVFLLVVASRLIRATPPDFDQARRIGALRFIGAGIGIGILSAILGIGGGTLSVPFLMRCGQPITRAIAVSAACGFPIAVAGSIGYITLGWNNPELPAATIGYIHVPALIGLSLTSIWFAPLGARTAHVLPARTLKHCFAVVLAAIAMKMLWQCRPVLESGVDSLSSLLDWP